LAERNQIYASRRDIVVDALRITGIKVNTPPAAIYVWAKIPEGATSMNFCNSLLEDAGVSTTPGSVYGDFGEGYFRISLGTSTDRICEAMERFTTWFKS
jgi:LL-diaminopimelate aminotransferase